MTKNSIKEWLSDSAKKIANRSEFPFLETQVLLAFVLEKKREWLITHLDDTIEPSMLNKANTQFRRLENGEPLPYIIGKQAFFGLDFFVTPDVLIPRPETEQLIEECIEWLEAHPTKRYLADVGTGSGIIPVVLADRFKDLQITAIDISTTALDVARKNADQFHVHEQISFVNSDLFQNCPYQFDLITANLPYIPSDILATLPVAKHEPLLALDGGKDGLRLIERLLSQSQEHLYPGGLLILEIESSLANSVLDLAKTLLPRASITLLNDLANLPRIIKIQV